MKNRNSYDAWGRPRSPSTWVLLPVSTVSTLVSLSGTQPRFDRGYTGHEQMAGFGLINMNGRLYDPYLQRFLSPDRYVQQPENAQSYNRYSYCLNSPLMYTDPSGWQYLAAIETYINPGFTSFMREATGRGGGSGQTVTQNEMEDLYAYAVVRGFPDDFDSFARRYKKSNGKNVVWFETKNHYEDDGLYVVASTHTIDFKNYKPNSEGGTDKPSNDSYLKYITKWTIRGEYKSEIPSGKLGKISFSIISSYSRGNGPIEMTKTNNGSFEPSLNIGDISLSKTSFSISTSGIISTSAGLSLEDGYTFEATCINREGKYSGIGVSYKPSPYVAVPLFVIGLATGQWYLAFP